MRTDEDDDAKSSRLTIDSTLTLSAQGLPAVKEVVSGEKMQGWWSANRPMNLGAIAVLNPLYTYDAIMLHAALCRAQARTVKRVLCS